MGSYQLFGETLSFRDDGKRKFDPENPLGPNNDSPDKIAKTNADNPTKPKAAKKSKPAPVSA